MTRIDTGSHSTIPIITGGIFEFGFSDAFQQMIVTFIEELFGKSFNLFNTVTPQEIFWSHLLFKTSGESNKNDKKDNFTAVLIEWGLNYSLY